ncbi:trap-t family transporter, large (12tms) inner membrane subunit [Roseobacter sp. GAI101]|nr:trap-t family transporter, large (12tms) inner membrane subunit [Roseobacter sp. GAI101]
MVLLLGSGLWIGLGLIATGATILALFRPQLPFVKLLAQQSWNVLSSPELLALPLFILMAEVLFRTNISASLFTGLIP